MAPPRIPKSNARFIDVEGESNRGMAALEALRGYAGAPSQASVMVPGALSAYEGGELAGMAEMLIPGASMAKGALGAALAGVIKHRGGNWIPGDVERGLNYLLKKEYSPASVDLQRTALEMARQRGYPDNMISELEFGLQQRESPIAVNRWIQGPLTKYIKRDLATPEDPLRKLAEQGILHFNPNIEREAHTWADEARFAASDMGLPARRMAVSPMAQDWETMADLSITPLSKSDMIKFEGMDGKNDWLSKLGENDVAYAMEGDPANYLSFDHIIDELSNALDPASGMPRNLQLRPEQMQQMGMEKAVRHVDAINKWRAANRAKENAELANRAAVLREYPDSPEMPNPKGLRWVELKAPEQQIPEGYEYDQRTGTWVDPWGEGTQPIRKDPNFGREELEKQLKYEGDTMGHCVGGYCPDVLEGRSRIFSLRDAKGEPHVTVEVNPEDTRKFLDEEEKNPEVQSFYNRVQSILDKRGAEEIPELEYVNMIKELPSYKNWLSNRQGMPSFKINQIKGKQNQAPKDDYLPFVQDFVRNNPLGGSWTDVGDLRNTGLRKVGDKYVTLDDLPEWKDGGIVEFPKVTPKAMLNRVISAYNAL